MTTDDQQSPPFVAICMVSAPYRPHRSVQLFASS
jgi:hypothetical protein